MVYFTFQLSICQGQKFMSTLWWIQKNARFSAFFGFSFLTERIHCLTKPCIQKQG
jgi:hypothetical protein